MTVVVTGASGHIGANLVRALLEAGEQVRVMVHRDVRAVGDLPVERVLADILDQESLVRAFENSEIVYHLAAHISIVRSDERQLFLVNVVGTRNVVDACLKCGVRRLVYTSSIEALLCPDRGDPIDESEQPNPDGPSTSYGRTKALAELEVHHGIQRGLDAVIVHPTAVVGPFDFKPSFFGQAFLDFGLKKLPALVPGGFDLVDVRDVVAGILAAGKKGRIGEHYILSGGYLTMSEIGETLEEGAGVPRPRLVVPFWLAHAVATFTPWYYRLTGRRPRFTRMALKMLQDGRQISCAKAKSELGYSPRPPREGMSAAVEWFRDAGLLPRRGACFRSRRDPGLVLLVAVVVLVCATGGLHLLINLSGPDRLLGLLALALGALYLWLTVPVAYWITTKELWVRGGPFRWRIPLEAIEEVRPTHNPIGAPSWSLRRLRVGYRKKGKRTFVLISPADREGFLAKLVAAASGLEHAGELSVRKKTG